MKPGSVLWLAPLRPIRTSWDTCSSRVSPKRNPLNRRCSLVHGNQDMWPSGVSHTTDSLLVGTEKGNRRNRPITPLAPRWAAFLISSCPSTASKCCKSFGHEADRRNASCEPRGARLAFRHDVLFSKVWKLSIWNRASSRFRTNTRNDQRVLLFLALADLDISSHGLVTF